MLIAQLSSAAGVRAPLAHIADEVFLNLSRELEQQGVSRKVVADMFGLALRGYQRRVQRLTQSSSQRGTTLWQAVMDFVEKQGTVNRGSVFERFKYDDASAVGAVLNDLTESGLLSRTGSAEETVYRVTQEHERAELGRKQTLETSSALVWLELCRSPEAPLEGIAARLGLSKERAAEALAQLEADGRVRREKAELIVEPLVIPLGAGAGWEVAVFDHYQTVCVALATKLQQGARAREGDTTGGQTLSFDIDEDHPEREAVLSLLQRTRNEANELWYRVQEHNAAHPREDRRRVAFYVGQVELSPQGES